MTTYTAGATASTVSASDSTEQREFFEELASLCDNRAATYGFIARLYRVEVDEQLLCDMKEMRFPVATGNSSTDKGYRLLASYLSKTWDNTITELAVDYVRTFIGNTNELDGAAFPFESVYTSEQRLRMQEARDEVLAVYRAYGLDKDPDWRDSEDHLALELEFMRILSQRTADALRAGDEDKAFTLLSAQRNFHADHVASWAPMLTSDMRHFAKTDFYQGLSYITDGFLETDGEFMTDMLAQGEA